MKRKTYLKKPNRKTIQITSMLDVFTILLVFLIKNISSDSDNMLNMIKEFELPYSHSLENVHKTYLIVIGVNGISVNNESVIEKANTSQLTAHDFDLMRKKIENMKAEVQKSKLKFSVEITIAADKKIPSYVIKNVLALCAENGFNQIYLATKKLEP